MKDLRITLIQTKLNWENAKQNLALFDALFNILSKDKISVIINL